VLGNVTNRLLMAALTKSVIQKILNISDVLYQNNPAGCFVAGPFVAVPFVYRTFRSQTFRRRTFRRQTFRCRTFCIGVPRWVSGRSCSRNSQLLPLPHGGLVSDPSHPQSRHIKYSSLLIHSSVPAINKPKCPLEK
jgi:hypothetical protein